MSNTDKTLQYYNEQASSFVQGTVDVEFSALQNEFVSRIGNGGRILDLGCGSGRDSKAFIRQGFDVVAVDGSKEMAKIASKYIGREVICSTFQDYKPEGTFDGIWACASLLHLTKDDIVIVMKKLTHALNEGGSFYVSFKYGEFSGERNGRYFTDLNEESFGELIANIPELKIQRQYITDDVRPGRAAEKWLNVFLIKKETEKHELKKEENTAVAKAKHAEMVFSGEGRRVLKLSTGTAGAQLNGILARVSQYVDMANAMSHIEKTTEYVVQIPLKYQKQFESGEYFINQNKTTGVEWPTLMCKLENGQYRFVDDLPIKQKEFIQGNPMNDVTQGFYNIAMQRELASLADAVQQTYEAVERIEHGQMDDRIGLLMSGREQITYALLLNDDSDKKRAIELGRKSIADAKGQIGLIMKRRIEEFKPVPGNSVLRFLMELRQTGYLTEKANEVYEIQDYYQLYLNATKLLAASYVVTGDTKAAEQVFLKSSDFLRGINFDSVKTIGYGERKEEAKDMFYSDAPGYLEIEHEKLMEDSRDYDYMTIEVTGQRLLEVLNDGKEEI